MFLYKYKISVRTRTIIWHNKNIKEFQSSNSLNYILEIYYNIFYNIDYLLNKKKKKLRNLKFNYQYRVSATYKLRCVKQYFSTLDFNSSVRGLKTKVKSNHELISFTLVMNTHLCNKQNNFELSTSLRK